MNKYYFFGAGNNCFGAIKFWGTDCIIAVVDNSATKAGTTILGLPIIGFEEFRNKWNGEQIIITSINNADQIAQQLKTEGINNYFICPYMQSGFYDCNEILERLKIKNYENFAVWDKNPISEKIVIELKKRKKCEIHYVSEDNLNENKEKCEVLIIVKPNGTSVSLDLENSYQKVFDLFNEIKLMQWKEFEYLKKYKGKYNGERCFLIGNGPSLTEKDLDKIYEHKVKSIGCNKIYKIFEKTKWRPEYCIISDSIVIEEEKSKFSNECKYFMRKVANLEPVDINVELYYANYENFYPQYPSFSDDITKGVYTGRTVMYDTLQIAMYMGFKEIYLLGVDFSWGEDGRDTHFCNDYGNDGLIKDAMHYKDELRHAYISAKNYADSHGIKIYNATRGGYLDVFERVDFDKIFCK